jgi:hypothetical protein
MTRKAILIVGLLMFVSGFLFGTQEPGTAEKGAAFFKSSGQTPPDPDRPRGIHEDASRRELRCHREAEDERQGRFLRGKIGLQVRGKLVPGVPCRPSTDNHSQRVTERFPTEAG